MNASQIGYGKVYTWVKSYLADTHLTVVATVAWVVLCVLVAQRLTPAELARAIPAELPGSGRSRLRLSDWIEVAQVYAQVSAHLLAGPLRPHESTAISLHGSRNAPEKRLIRIEQIGIAMDAAPSRLQDPREAAMQQRVSESAKNVALSTSGVRLAAVPPAQIPHLAASARLLDGSLHPLPQCRADLTAMPCYSRMR